MHVLIIGDTERARVQQVRDHAAVHKFFIKDLMEVVKNPSRSAGYDTNFVVEFPIGWRCVYTIEQQPACWCIHFSVSWQGRIPPKHMVETGLYPVFGLDAKDVIATFREQGPQALPAINLLFKLPE